MNEREPLFQEAALRRIGDILCQQWRGAPAICRSRPTVVNLDWSTFGTRAPMVGYRALLVIVPETTKGSHVIDRTAEEALSVGELVFDGRRATMTEGQL